MYYKNFLELACEKINNIQFCKNNLLNLYDIYFIDLQIYTQKDKQNNTYIETQIKFENILKYYIDENIYKSDNTKESIVIIKDYNKYIFYSVIKNLDFNPYLDVYLSINQFIKDYNLEYIEKNNFYTLYECNIIKKSSFIYLYKNPISQIPLEIKFIKPDEKSSVEDKIIKINKNKSTNQIYKILLIIKVFCEYIYDYNYDNNDIHIATIYYDFVLYKNILKFNNLEKFNKNILLEIIEFIKNDTNKNEIHDEIIKIDKIL
jgi:hypothetical protein